MTEVSRPGRRWPRVLFLIACTLMLHLWLVSWGKRHLVAQAPQDQQSFTVELHPVPPPQQPVALPQARPRPRPVKAAAPAAARKPASAPAPASIDPPDEPIRETVETIAAPQPAASTPGEAEPAAAAGDGAAPAAQDTQANQAAPEEASATPGVHYETNPPPSARLEYDVQATYNQLPVHGAGTLDWKTDGKTYRVDGKAEDFLFTFLNFSSSGAIDDFGVSPELYTEKRIRKAATNTHFNRERDVISFSASTESYPRHGGEQDRASLIWQLSAIGRGDAARYQPGAVLDFFVAGVRDGEIWRIQVLGEEDVKLPIGTLHAWHVVRVPKPGSYDQRIDIWLAPGQEWYPVRLRYTDPRQDGDFLDMSLEKIRH